MTKQAIIPNPSHLRRNCGALSERARLEAVCEAEYDYKGQGQSSTRGLWQRRMKGKLHFL